jgi:hypothetical protein
MRIVASENADGPLLEKRLPAFDAAAWTRAIETVLDSAAAVSEAGRDLVPQAAWGKAAEQVAAALDGLADAGVESRTLDVLAASCARLPSYRPLPQHGDLWPRNVVGHGSGWWIIDLERFGEIDVPLYDTFHLVRTATASWRSAEDTASFLDILAENDWRAPAARAVLRRRAEALGLAPAEIAATYAFYLVDLVAMIVRREQVAAATRTRLAGELAQLADRCRDLEAFGRWLVG